MEQLKGAFQFIVLGWVAIIFALAVVLPPFLLLMWVKDVLS